MPSRRAASVLSFIELPRRLRSAGAFVLRRVRKLPGPLGEELRHEALTLAHTLHLYGDRLHRFLDAYEARLDHGIAVRRRAERRHLLSVLEQHSDKDDERWYPED